MNRATWKAVRALTIFVLGIAAVAAQGQKPQGHAAAHAVFVSDIHFEPFWDPGKVSRLAAAPDTKWRAILAAADSPDRERRFAALENACPSRGTDTPYPLLSSAVDAIRAHATDARFVLMSGDLMAHQFDCKYRALFPHAKPYQYRSFTEKTIRFVLGELQSAAPRVPVYATLGNNDSDCGDYKGDAHSAFLESTAQAVTRNFPHRERAAALTSFAANGSYSVMLPAPMQNTRLIAVDDVFLSSNHTACSGKDDAADQQRLLAWVGQQLDSASRAKQKVWVMAHIAPGIDAYATLAHITGACGRPPKLLLSSEKLADILKDHAGTVTLGIFGHTHEDEIALLERDHSAGSAQEQQPAIPVKIVPSISPLNGNDPSFTVAEIDPATTTLTDYQVIAGGRGKPWTERYDYAKAYGESSFSAPAIKQLVEQFETDPKAKTAASDHYIHNFLTGSHLPLLSLVWPQYVCTMAHTSAAGFTDCACKAQ